MNQFISRIAALTLAVAMAAAPTTAYAANYNDMDSVTNTGVSTKVSQKLAVQKPAHDIKVTSATYYITGTSNPNESLYVNGQQLVDSPDFPAAIKPGATAARDIYTELQKEQALDWTVLSPAVGFHGGSAAQASGRTGNYDVRIENQNGQLIALFHGKSYKVRGTVLAQETPDE